jgi:Domain of unknown function (DUF222)
VLDRLDMSFPEMSPVAASIKFMFDLEQSGSGPVSTLTVPSDGDPAPVPLERLEAQICELAGHLAAATCRFLVLLGDFDTRRGWADWEMTSCAAWLSWKCQMSSGTAREHVRVARALRDLPVIRTEFAAGRLSYAKVRALTRIATPDTEAFLGEKVAAADDPEVYQVIVHVGIDALTPANPAPGPPAGGGDVSAETSGPSRQAPDHPADPSRCHVEDGPAISVTVAQTIACSSALSWMLHDSAGQLLNLGRRRRRSPGPSKTATTRASPLTRSSRPGTASGWTWTTLSTSASPTRPARPASRTMPRRRPRQTSQSRSGSGKWTIEPQD